MAIEKPEWFRMDPAKFLQDREVDEMTTLELGACFRLLCRQWIDGYVPDDQRALARLCRLDIEVMGQVWVALSPFFPEIETGKRANRYMWIERERVMAELQRKSDEGLKWARKRWQGHKKANGSTDGSPTGTLIADPMLDQTTPDQTRAHPSPDTFANVVDSIGHLYPRNKHLEGRPLPQLHEYLIANAVHEDGEQAVVGGTKAIAEAAANGYKFVPSVEKFFGPEKQYLKDPATWNVEREQVQPLPVELPNPAEIARRRRQELMNA